MVGEFLGLGPEWPAEGEGFLAFTVGDFELGSGANLIFRSRERPLLEDVGVVLLWLERECEVVVVVVEASLCVIWFLVELWRLLTVGTFPESSSRAKGNSERSKLVSFFRPL